MCFVFEGLVRICDHTRHLRVVVVVTGGGFGTSSFYLSESTILTKSDALVRSLGGVQGHVRTTIIYIYIYIYILYIYI